MSDPPIAGERVDQYELQELVARSGMAAVFKARDTLTGAIVALKIPHFHLDGDPVFAERFRREEEVGQTLDHPHLVRTLRPREKTRTYLAMEYVEGRPLRTLLGKTPLPASRALDLVRQVGDALAYLGSRGVVHRDVKPENVLVTADGQAKLIDFGIALVQAEPRVTQAIALDALGTPDYMAPEQIQGRPGDARTDVYALGMLLYELLTAHLPYDGPDAAAILRAKVREEPLPPSDWVPGLDRHLEAIILKALERDPRHRQASAAELLRDLADPAAVPWRPPGRSRRARLLRRRLGVAAVLAVVAALLALAWVEGRSAERGRRQRPPAARKNAP